MSNKAIKLFKDYIVITLAVIIMDLGIYAFKFPNHFSFGGVSGLAVVLNEILGISAAQINLVINLALLVIGFAVLGKSFGLKTAYATVLSSVVLSLMEKMMPISAPLTNQPMLELAYAIALPAVAAAMLFYVDASGGGTDIVAMILKKYTTIDIGTALLISDVAIVALSFIAFDVRTGLFSVCGLLAKSIFVDRTMDQMRLCKYFTIISSDPEPICDFIQNGSAFTGRNLLPGFKCFPCFPDSIIHVFLGSLSTLSQLFSIGRTLCGKEFTVRSVTPLPPYKKLVPVLKFWFVHLIPPVCDWLFICARV